MYDSLTRNATYRVQCSVDLLHLGCLLLDLLFDQDWCGCCVKNRCGVQGWFKKTWHEGCGLRSVCESRRLNMNTLDPSISTISSLLSLYTVLFPINRAWDNHPSTSAVVIAVQAKRESWTEILGGERLLCLPSPSNPSNQLIASFPDCIFSFRASGLDLISRDRRTLQSIVIFAKKEAI